jgi:SagB-type dehydrogenase family enzyme
MNSAKSWFRATELDRANFPELRDQILASDLEPPASEPRSYPGYPRWPLPRVQARLWPSLDRVLLRRRCAHRLTMGLPSRRELSRLLRFAHGVVAPGGRGPVPSAGSLQGLELYFVTFETGWLPAGLYHYDRLGHQLSQLAAGADRAAWRECVPSLGQVEGGGILWVVVGDAARIESKYGDRAYRFLLLEAGHLMQNLCLLSTSLGLSTVPLGGFFERDIAREFALPATDVVLYVGLGGKTTAG